MVLRSRFLQSFFNEQQSLSQSQAVVRIYKGSEQVRTFNVPSNQGGTLWTVFELNGDEITPINSLSYES